MSYTSKDVTEGSIWVSNTMQRFQVISITEIENHTWVYYRKFNAPPEDCREFSCYVESFLSRFSKTVNE